MPPRLRGRFGPRADIASEGGEARARLERARYDVVLMDVQMPEMDGLEASRAICARWPSGLRPRIVAMTAEAMPGDHEKCLAAGMDDYIVKPVTLDQLREALAKCRPLGGAAAGVEDQGLRAAEIAIDPDVLDQLREDLGGNAGLHEVIVTFLEKTPAALASLHDAVMRADTDAIRRIAHMIRGTSASLGARPLAERCAELERLSQTGVVLDAPSRVVAIEASYRQGEADPAEGRLGGHIADRIAPRDHRGAEIDISQAGAGDAGAEPGGLSVAEPTCHRQTRRQTRLRGGCRSDGS